MSAGADGIVWPSSLGSVKHVVMDNSPAASSGTASMKSAGLPLLLQVVLVAVVSVEDVFLVLPSALHAVESDAVILVSAVPEV